MEERVSFSSVACPLISCSCSGRLPSAQAEARTSNIKVVYHMQKEKVKWERGLWAPAEQRGEMREGNRCMKVLNNKKFKIFLN